MRAHKVSNFTRSNNVHKTLKIGDHREGMQAYRMAKRFIDFAEADEEDLEHMAKLINGVGSLTRRKLKYLYGTWDILGEIDDDKWQPYWEDITEVLDKWRRQVIEDSKALYDVTMYLNDFLYKYHKDKENTNESVNFERGVEPTKSLSVGKYKDPIYTELLELRDILYDNSKSNEQKIIMLLDEKRMKPFSFLKNIKENKHLYSKITAVIHNTNLEHEGIWGRVTPKESIRKFKELVNFELLKMGYVKESLGFTRSKTVTGALDIGVFKNQIDWDNLPVQGMYRVVAGTSDADFDECIIVINGGRVFMVKAWENSAAEGEWIPDEWNIRAFHEIDLSPEEFLKQNNAFNLVQLWVKDWNGIPSYDTITNDLDESNLYT